MKILKPLPSGRLSAKGFPSADRRPLVRELVTFLARANLWL